MNIIPIEHVHALCCAYGLGTYVSEQKVSSGVLNTAVIVTTDSGIYFIKSVRHKVRPYIKTVCMTEHWMHEAEIPAVAMLSTIDGNESVLIDDHLYTVYPFIKGLTDIEPLPAVMRECATMLARIHHRGREVAPFRARVKEMSFDPGRDTRTVNILEECREVIGSIKDRSELDQTFADSIDYKLSAMTTIAPIPQPTNDTIIHGDFHAGNIIFSPEHTIRAICDWEKSEYAPRMYEVARSVFLMCFYVGCDKDRSLTYAQEFLNTYMKAIPTSVEEVVHGFRMRLHHMTASSWLEDMHYLQHTDRADHFVAHEYWLLRECLEEGLVDKICAGVVSA